MSQSVLKVTLSKVILFPKQESPPAWTQEAYRPPRSKCSLCWSVLGGYPVPCLGGYPIPGLGGYPISGPRGVPHPRSGGVPHPRSRGLSTQSRHGMGYPPGQTWDGVPPRQDLGWGTPSQTWDGVPTQTWDPEMGYPPHKCGHTHRLVSKHYLPSYYVRGR